MTATHNLNELCSFKQRMALFSKLIKVFFPGKETDVCRSQHVINFILLIDCTNLPLLKQVNPCLTRGKRYDLIFLRSKQSVKHLNYKAVDNSISNKHQADFP